jgi:hypothetical protein
MPGTLPVGFGDYQQQPEHRTRSTSGSHTEATEQHHVDRTRIIQIDSTLMAKSGRVGLTCGPGSRLGSFEILEAKGEFLQQRRFQR